MGADPLSARRRTLLRMAEHVALQVSAHAAADAWWEEEESRTEWAARIHHATERARTALADAEHAVLHEQNASAGAAPSLLEVKAWVSECRRWLALARPEAARSVNAARDALRCDVRRLTGGLAMLRAAIWEWELQRAALEPELPVADLLQRARHHLAVLEGHASAVDDAAAQRQAAAERAGEAQTDLRRLLQVTRRVWSVVVARSRGAVPELDWGIGRAEVYSRPSNRKADP